MFARSFFAASILTGIAFAGGCGGGNETASTTTPSTSSTTSDGTSSATGGAGGSTTGSTTSSATGGAAPTGYKAGGVVAASGPNGAAYTHGHHVGASFQYFPNGSPPVYTDTAIGPCLVRVTAASPPFGTPVFQSAGTITVEGGLQTLTLTPDASSVYHDIDDDTADLFNGGETIVFKAAGDVVPAFTASLEAPSAIDVTQPPEPASNDPLPVDRTADLVFAWNGGAAGSVLVSFVDGAGAAMTCTFASSAGKGVVPAAALAKLAAKSTGIFSIGPASWKLVDAGDWQISALLTASLHWNGVADPQTISYQATN